MIYVHTSENPVQMAKMFDYIICFAQFLINFSWCFRMDDETLFVLFLDFRF